MVYQLPIVFIGPMATGKSTVAREVARLTGVPQVPMDRVRWYYYFKDGFSLEREAACESFAEKIAYWKPFEVSAVRRILAEFPDSVIDFGAGHSYFTDEAQFAEAQACLAPLRNVFLLLPSADKEESLAICNERLRARVGRVLQATEIEANRDFIFHASNARLSKHILYTQDEAPCATAERVFSLLS